MVLTTQSWNLPQVGTWCGPSECLDLSARLDRQDGSDPAEDGRLAPGA